MTMNGKVLISFLGTNNYIDTYYQLEDGKRSSLVKYIQEALIELICRYWNVTDMIYIFCTDGENGSYNKNWEGSGNLKERLTNREIRPKIECKTIPEGFTKEEVWKIFDIVTDIIEPEYEIYLDITHSFRSIPLFSTTLFDYLKVMKGTELKHIYYGAFEKLGPAYMVKDMPHEKRIAPIIDMAEIVELQKTIMAAHDYKSFGKLSFNLPDEISGNDNGKISDALNTLREELDNLDFYINTCQLKRIQNGLYMQKIKVSFNNAMKSKDINNAEKSILQKIYSTLTERFSSESNNQNIEAAIKWVSEKNMYQQAFTLAQEYIIGLVCDKLYDYYTICEYSGHKKGKIRFREFTASMLRITQQDIDNHNLKGELENKDIEIIKTISEYQWMKELKTPYDNISQYRNTLNHAKTINGSPSQTPQETIRKVFDENFEQALSIIKNTEQC